MDLRDLRFHSLRDLPLQACCLKRQKIFFLGPTHQEKLDLLNITKLLLLPATSPRLSVTSLASCAPPLPGRCGLGGGITKAGPGRPLQCTSASTPPSWTYQSPPLPPKAPPPPGSSSSSLVSELGQEDPHSAPEASPAL